MRLVLFACAALALVGCRTFREFEITPPSKVAMTPPKNPDALGQSHRPYAGMPRYLASARPLLPTTSDGRNPNPNPCAVRSAQCDERLRALLASIDGQILALSAPPTDVQLAALRLDLAQAQPMLAPYTDITSERDELAALVDKVPSMTRVEQEAAKRRMIQLSDLIRVQLAAAD